MVRQLLLLRRSPGDRLGVQFPGELEQNRTIPILTVFGPGPKKRRNRIRMIYPGIVSEFQPEMGN